MAKANNNHHVCVLIIGNLGLVASHVAVQYLLRSDSARIRVVHPDANELKAFLELVQEVAGFVQPGGMVAEQVTSRLEMKTENLRAAPEAPAEAPVERVFADQAWYFAGTGDEGTEVKAAIRSISAALGSAEVAELNCVVVPFARRASSWLTNMGTNENPRLAKSLGTAVAELCRSRNMGYRIFATAMLLARSQPPGGLIREGLVSFATTLYELKREIGARCADYFEFEPLRYAAPSGATLDLIPAEQAGKLMMDAAEQPDTLNKRHYVGSLAKTLFDDLCEDLSSIYELELVPVQDSELLNDIDKLFCRRLHGFAAHLSADSTGEQQLDCEAGENRIGTLGPRERLALLGALRRSQDTAWQGTKERVATMPGTLKETIIVQNGTPLLYYSAGQSETPLILINALGQDLDYWYPLVDYLRTRQRVILWEQRGTMLPPYPFQLTDQLSDLEAILKHEGIKKCYLVAWCTGLKISMAFHLQHPEIVTAMVALNGSLHTFDTPPELETTFEHNFGPVCRMVNETPRIAASVKSLLASSLEDKELDLFADLPKGQVATEVLSRANTDLKPHIMAPFRTEAATVNYCRQILDFKAHDPRQSAGQIDVPILFIGAEHDKLVSAAAVEHAAKLFPRGRYLHVQGATHYFLYDQAHVAGELIDRVITQATDGA